MYEVILDTFKPKSQIPISDLHNTNLDNVIIVAESILNKTGQKILIRQYSDYLRCSSWKHIKYDWSNFYLRKFNHNVNKGFLSVKDAINSAINNNHKVYVLQNKTELKNFIKTNKL